MKKHNLIKITALLLVLMMLLTACFDSGTPCANGHTYDNACDAECNVCDTSRTPEEHAYDNACDASCNHCGESRTPAEHTYDSACDASCNVCGESRTPGNHAYDNPCDAVCNLCGASRTPAEHVYDNACDASCNHCGESRTVADHTDESEDGLCDECGAAVDSGSDTPEKPAVSVPVFDASQIPEFDNSVEYIPICGNIPNFTKGQITTESYAYYSPLDALGRAGLTVACLGRELFPTADRGSLPNPTGWHSSSIYERSHLIAHSLAGFDEANNLITGTYDLNGVMQEFEEMVKAYIIETNNHVMYRVIPIFEGDNLVASGVTMEAWSVEDQGEGICFNIYIYNAQDDEVIDYATGDVTLPEHNYTFVVNRNNGKIHTATCSNVAGMKDENKMFFEGSYAELIAHLNAQGKSWSNAGCCSPQNSTAGQVLFTLPEDKYYLA